MTLTLLIGLYMLLAPKEDAYRGTQEKEEGEPFHLGHVHLKTLRATELLRVMLQHPSAS